MTLIGLVGKKNSGKTTVAQFLSTLGYVEISFAEPVKQITEIVFGFDYDMLLGDTPEKRHLRNTLKDPIWDLTPVQAMQLVGTEIFRDNFDQDIWIKLAYKKIKQYDLIVVSDVRFPNEIEFIRNNGGKLIILYENLEDLNMNQNGHASEVSFQQAISNKDILIFNDKSKGKEYLFDKIKMNL